MFLGNFFSFFHKRSPDILTISRRDRYRTVDELFSHLRSVSVYFVLLGLSAVIVSAGVLLNNSAITIGGMLVAPLLTPLLIIGLVLATGHIRPLWRVLLLIISSFLMVILVSGLMSMIFSNENITSVFDRSEKVMLLYAMVAIASGAAGAFAWCRREVSEALPGVSVAVTLVPPLSLMGIWLAQGDWPAFVYYASMLGLNVSGIVIGSFLVFVLLGFHSVNKSVQSRAEE
ncbi:MAG: DUF389 domain-containing protein [Patescibacteria group bacterium]|nr:MAG: DUF389 domain-containing protein [Patescibacteria group bacterium]